MIDCTRLRLYSIPLPESDLHVLHITIVNYNNLGYFNISVLISLLPWLVIIDISGMAIGFFILDPCTRMSGQIGFPSILGESQNLGDPAPPPPSKKLLVLLL